MSRNPFPVFTPQQFAINARETRDVRIASFTPFESTSGRWVDPAFDDDGFEDYIQTEACRHTLHLETI